MKNIMKLIGVGFAVSALFACSSNSKTCSSKVAESNVAKVESAEQAALPTNISFSGEDQNKESHALLNQNTMHFDFDRSDLSEADLSAIYAHAEYLLKHPEAHLRIAGHTDKFGSHEYNIALGERRAKSIMNVLMLKGVPSAQLSTVSYGKESPFNLADDEEAWKANRRAELIYLES